MRSGGWFAGFACALSLSACSGSGGGDETNSPPPVLQSIAITPTFASTGIGETRQFTATGAYSDGHTQNVTATVSWGSSVAEVASINAQGIATAVAGGSTTIVATMGSVSAQTSLTVSLPAAWTFEIHNPSNGALVAPTLFVAASIQGPGEIDSVTAQAGGNSTNLTFFNSHPQCLDSGGLPRSCWAGELTLPATFGMQHRVVVEADDALGNSVAVVRNVVVDQRPIVEVDAPVAGAIARTQLQLAATCSDDAPSGCASLTAAVCSPVGAIANCSDPVAQGTDSIAATVDLQAHNGHSRQLRYLATDTAGQQTAVFIPIFVEDSQHLTPVDEVAGTILDVDGTRLLHWNGELLTLSDRAGGSGTDIQAGVTEEPPYAFLTTAGAAFVLRSTSVTQQTAISWENGASVELGPAIELSAAGSYVLWSDDESDLQRRDVVAADSELVSSDALDNGNTVIANGTVAFAERMNDIYNIAVLAVGDPAPTFLTSGTTVANAFPRTDGTSFLFRRQAGDEYRLILLRNGAEEEIAGPTDRVFLPDSGYQIAGGWLAFLREGMTGVTQVWRAEPGEQPVQLSAFGTDSRIERLAADGTVVFVSGGRRYLVLPGATSPVDVGSDLGRSFFVDDVPHVAIGGTLFRVQ